MIEAEITPQITVKSGELSDPAQDRAAAILAEAAAAKEAGDETKLAELRQQVNDDPELSQAVAQGSSSSSEQPAGATEMPKQSAGATEMSEQSTGSAENTSIAPEGLTPEDLVTVRRVQAELSQKWQQLQRLSHGSFMAGAPTESLFTEGEMEGIIGKMEGLDTAIDDGESLTAVGEAIQAFSAWYEQAQPTVQAKMRSLVGYFGGYPPSELIAQAKLFDAMETDVSNLKHYFDLIQE